jgi:hypothetical protein
VSTGSASAPRTHSRRAYLLPVTRFPAAPARVRTNGRSPAARPTGWCSTRRSGCVGARRASTTTHSRTATHASHPHPTSRAASQPTGPSTRNPATHPPPNHLKTL